jgi:hypothetical protein
VTFLALVLHNVGVRKLRLALTALAVAIGVVTVVSLGVVTSSLESSELAIMQTGRADFTIAQKGGSDILNSSIDQAQLERWYTCTPAGSTNDERLLLKSGRHPPPLSAEPDVPAHR